MLAKDGGLWVAIFDLRFEYVIQVSLAFTKRVANKKILRQMLPALCFPNMYWMRCALRST